MPLIIALKDLMILARDRKALLLIIAMPLILILIIGASLESQFSSDTGIKKFIIGIEDKDESLISNILINKVFRDNMEDMVEVYPINENELWDKVNKKVIPVGIIIPSGFSQNIEEGKMQEIKILALPDNSLRAGIIQSVIKSFVDTVSRNYAAAGAVENILYRNNISITSQFDGISEKMAVMIDMSSKIKKSEVEFISSEKQKNKGISSMQYYSVSMMVMFVLFSANTGSRFLLAERENSTLARLLATSNSWSQILIGKFIGMFLMNLASALIILVFTKIVYRVEWGDSMGAIAVMLMSVSFAAAGFGLFIAAIVKTSNAAAGIGNLIIQIFTLLSGGMIPLFIMPEFLKKIAMISPSYWASTSFYAIMSGAGVGEILSYSLILLAIGTLMSSIGIARFKAV